MLLNGPKLWKQSIIYRRDFHMKPVMIQPDRNKCYMLQLIPFLEEFAANLVEGTRKLLCFSRCAPKFREHVYAASWLAVRCGIESKCCGWLPDIARHVPGVWQAEFSFQIKWAISSGTWLQAHKTIKSHEATRSTVCRLIPLSHRLESNDFSRNKRTQDDREFIGNTS